MATITAGDFRNGKTFEMDGKVMQVIEFQHVKPGKGAAFVRLAPGPGVGLHSRLYGRNRQFVGAQHPIGGLVQAGEAPLGGGRPFLPGDDGIEIDVRAGHRLRLVQK